MKLEFSMDFSLFFFFYRPKKKILGYTTRNSGGVPANFKNYFVIQFDKAFAENLVWSNHKAVSGQSELTDNHVGAAIRFTTEKGERIHARVASSFISFDQAGIKSLYLIRASAFNGNA